MQRRLRTLLEHAGLTEDEIRLYLTLLRMQRASVPSLMSALSLPSSTAYRTVGKLRERGMILAEPMNGKQELLRPLTLRALTQKIAADSRKLRRLELSLEGLDLLLPFIAKEETPSLPEEPIEILETLEEFKKHYFDLPNLYRKSGQMLSYGSMDSLYATMGFGYGTKDEDAFIRKRLVNHLSVAILCAASQYFPQMAKRNREELRLTRISNAIADLKNFYIMNCDTVSIFLTQGASPRVLVIRQPELVASYRDRFSSYWQTASIA